MKLRFFAILMAIVMLLLPYGLTASAESAQIAYSVEGGNIYFDPSNGSIVRCDETVVAAKIPSEINGIAVTSIDNFAFEYCPKLKKVMLSEGITSIGRYAFTACYVLTAVHLPESLITIADGAFYDCPELKLIHLGSNITQIGNYAFEGTAFYNDDSNWTGDLLYIENYLIRCRNSFEGVCEIPEGTTVIAGGAFYTCTALTEVKLPSSLRSICNESFYYCIALKSIAIGDNVQHIGASAFRYCAALETVHVGNGVCAIEKDAFSFCNSLKIVTLGKNVRRIDDSAFAENKNLLEIYFYGDAPTLGNRPFEFYDYSQSAYVPPKALTLYYIPARSGWNHSDWSSYPCKPWHPSAEFTDVIDRAWYQDAVDYALAEGLMNGISETSFAPNQTMNRAMLVTVLWRYAGRPSAEVNKFTDVPNGKWFTAAVAWAAENGIVSGVSAQKFDPYGSITREQLAVIFYRYCNFIGLDTSARADLSTFPDCASISNYASDALRWAVNVELIAGTKFNGYILLDPQGSATRAQVATIFMRFIEKVTK